MYCRKRQQVELRCPVVGVPEPALFLFIGDWRAILTGLALRDR